MTNLAAVIGCTIPSIEATAPARGGIHPLHPIQLAIRSSSRVEQPRLLQETDRTFDGDDGGTALLKNGIADDECIGQTGGLRRRQSSETGTSVG